MYIYIDENVHRILFLWKTKKIRKNDEIIGEICYNHL